MFHCQPPETMRKDQDFPVSIEVQFLGGLGQGNRTDGQPLHAGHERRDRRQAASRTHCTNSKSKTFHGDQWVTAEIEVHGGKVIKHFINGEEVLEYEQPQFDDRDADGRPLIKDGKMLISEGYISLQAESHPIEFRKVELLPLKD